MCRILVVDDDGAYCRMLERVLEENGHQVLAAANGVEAIQSIRFFSPQLVITDLFMPEMDGIELLRALQRLSAVPKVIVLSGGTRFILPSAFLEMAGMMGADKVMHKPVAMRELLSSILALTTGPLPESVPI